MSTRGFSQISRNMSSIANRSFQAARFWILRLSAAREFLKTDKLEISNLEIFRPLELSDQQSA